MSGLDELDGPVDIEALERQLAELAVTNGDASEVLARLAEAVFPGGTGIGDPARTLWPEPERADAFPGPDSGPTDAGTPAARQDLEAHIRKSETRYRSLVEQLPAVVFYAALGADENEAYVSPQIEALLGFTQAEWLTNPLLWYSQLHPDDHAIVIDAFTKGMQTGQPFRAEVRFFSRDGEEVWILGEARLIRDEADRPAYFQGVAFDITMTKRAQALVAEAARAKERAKVDAAQLRADTIASHNARLRLLNKELHAAKDEAEASARARTTFLTTMSHELRTPLNSVIVLAGLLADSELSGAQQDMLRRMRLASDNLLELINDVLEFSRLRAGHVELDRKSFDLPVWLEDTLDIVAPRATEKGLELRLAIADDVPRTLSADQGRLRQVLLNLLANAVKFTTAGFVEVEVRAVAVVAGRWEYTCAVRDSGRGIKPEDAAKLFEEFRQADSGIAREFGGTGLGLAICKRLCDLLGGRIWVEQSDTPGATVMFTWVADADESSVPVPGSVASEWRYGDGHAPGGAGASAAPEGAAPPEPAPLDAGATAPGAPAAGATAAGESGAGTTDRERERAEAVAAAMARGALAVAAGGPEGAGDGGATPSGLRVLIAEDNLMNQQVALLLLAAMGHKADVVGNGDEAIDAVRHRAYDVILMDVAMPGTDGISATRAIRTLGPAVHQPYIVALTAHAFPGDADSCIAAGMDDYVAKPIDRVLLAKALAEGASRAAKSFTTPTPAPRGDSPPAVAGGAGTRPPDFDPAVPRELLSEFGPGPLGQLLAVFRPEANRLVESAREAVAQGDVEAAERAAHKLKSSAANMGAVALQSSCSRLEALARSGSLAGTAALTEAMVWQLADALEQLDEILASASPT
jgi:PAS domain S-box-containing protein